MAATPTFLSTLGIAKEVTPGTPVAPTAFLRVTDFKGDPKVQYLADEGLRGSMAKTYGEVPGVSWTEYDFGGDVYADDIGWVLAGLLADVSTTGTSDPYTTQLALLNSGNGQPGSYTLTDYNAINSRAHSGIKFQKVDLKFAADDKFQYTTHVVGLSAATASFTTASFQGTTVIPNWQCSVTLGAVASAIVTDGTLTIARSVNPVHAADGTAAPASIFGASDLEATGSLTLVYDANAETALAAYLAGTYGTVTLDWLQSGTREVRAQMSLAVIDDYILERPQGKWGEAQVKFTACANTTDVGTSAGFSPIKCLLRNQNPSGTYK